MTSIQTRFIKQYRAIRYQLFKKQAPQQLPADRGVEVDIILPVIEKDLQTLPLCLRGIQEGINHPIRAIYLVAPPTPALIRFAEANNLRFVDEQTVLGYTPKEIGFITDKGENRSGWIFQQLLKLSACIGTCRHYITIDADHILLCPHTFITPDHSYVLYRSREYYPPYRRNIVQLLGECRTSVFDLSFIAHKMVFDRERVVQLQQTLSERHHTTWDKAIVGSLNRSVISPFSEFETYGNFLHPSLYRSLPWREKSIQFSPAHTFESLQHTYGKSYHAVTVPEYEQKIKPNK